MADKDRRLALVERRVELLEERVRRLESRQAAGRRVELRLRPGPDVQPGTTQPGRTAAASPVRMRAAEPPRQTPAPQATPDVPTFRHDPPPTPPPAPRAARPSRSLSDVEALLTGRVLAWAGGLAILVGALFFLVQAFRNNWIGVGGRVAIGVVAGAALFLGGAWFFERREALLGHVLVATGLGTLSLAFVAATRLYGLIPAQVGLLCSLATAIAAAIIAVRASSQVVAAYGLVTALAAPPLLGAAPTPSTVGFVGAALVGVAAIALYRSWSWLPPLAFVLSAPQLVSWLDARPSRPAALAALAGFWALYALAAGGEEFRTRRGAVLRPTSATLLLANAAFLVASGFMVLDGPDEAGARGVFLLCAALGHFLLGGYFLYDEHDRHPFGLLAFGSGLAALSMAIPVALGGPVVPVAWAAEAAALAWVYSLRRHGYSAAAAALLGSLAVAHLVCIEYPAVELLYGEGRGRPFLNSSWGTLLFLLGALGAAGLWVRRPRKVRTALASVGFLLVLYALPFEVSGLTLLACWSAVWLLAAALDRTSRPMAAGAPGRLALDLRAVSWLAAVLIGGHYVLSLLSPFDLGRTPAVPFVDSYSQSAGVLILACLVGAALTSAARARRGRLLGAFAAAAWLMPFELAAASVVVGWCALAAGLCLLASRDRGGVRLYASAAAALGMLALLVTFLGVADPDRLTVSAFRRVSHPPFWSGASAALVSLACLFGLAYWLARHDRRATWLGAAAGALAVYALSVGIVDEFQRHLAAGGVNLGELRKGAQVTLSIVWAALGGLALVAGIARRLGLLRAGGLALLGVATTKVFLYDLASLDATYRVPSFVGLGVLLLASSYAYQRLKHHLTGATGPH